MGGLAGDGTDDGANCVAVGYAALSANCGDENTAVGKDAGLLITGGGNVCLGHAAGDALTSGNQNVIIGSGTDAATVSTNNAITLGIGIAASANDFSFGKVSNVVTNDFDTDADWSRSSDVRIKKNINDITLGLNFVKNLRPVKYNYKPSDELDENDADLKHLRVDKDYNPVDHQDFDGTVVNQMNTSDTMYGLIAQEVKTALDTAGVDDFRGWHVDDKNIQQVSMTRFIAPMLKALQELSAKNDALEARIATLEG